MNELIRVKNRFLYNHLLFLISYNLFCNQYFVSEFKKVGNYNIKLYGGDIQLTTYSGGHSSTDPAFETQALIEWMVSQRRKT